MHSKWQPDKPSVKDKPKLSRQPRIFFSKEVSSAKKIIYLIHIQGFEKMF